MIEKKHGIATKPGFQSSLLFGCHWKLNTSNLHYEADNGRQTTQCHKKNR
jgi:hypothetical protein